jgi:hypothetical protein
MQVGDLVKNDHVIGLGIILKTPMQTTNHEFLVQFIGTNGTITLHCLPHHLELIS